MSILLDWTELCGARAHSVHRLEMVVHCISFELNFYRNSHVSQCPLYSTVISNNELHTNVILHLVYSCSAKQKLWFDSSLIALATVRTTSVSKASEFEVYALCVVGSTSVHVKWQNKQWPDSINCWAHIVVILRNDVNAKRTNASPHHICSH